MKALASSVAALSAVWAVWGMLACGGSPQMPPNEASRESQTGSGYARTVSPNEPAPVDPTARGAANPQAVDPSTSAVPSSTSSSSSSPSTTISPPTHTDAWGHPLPETAPAPATTSHEADLSSLNDAQLAAVVEAIYDGEIRLAQVALSHATSPGVKRLAHEMLVAYEGTMGKDKTLWARLQLSPSANPVSKQLDAETQKEAALLSGMRGAEFDREYVDGQIRDHGKALDLLDRITANVDAALFKTELTAVRPKLEGHLRLAESAQQDTQKGVTNRQPAAPGTP